MTTTLEALQEKAVAFRDERDWEQFHQPKDLAMALQVEAGELGELFLWKTREECVAALGETDFRARFEEELADVQIYLLYLAQVAGVSIPEAVEKKLEVNGEKYPVGKARGSAKKWTEYEQPTQAPERPVSGGVSRVVAVDWSGDAKTARKKIWLCEVMNGRVTRLECGRSREQIAAELLEEARRDPRFVVGLDFAFSFPEWFLTERNCRGPEDAWKDAADNGEEWLERSPFPFWGKPGKKKPLKVSLARRAELVVAKETGFTPLSVFQIGGAGAVGVGSIRGMPMLSQLRAAGFSIWPFDEPAFSEGRPLVVEIWPRLFMGGVKKSQAEERVAFLAGRYPGLDASVREAAEKSDDAFDALVSALEMDRHREEFAGLRSARDPVVLLEGDIWRSGVRVGRPQSAYHGVAL